MCGQGIACFLDPRSTALENDPLSDFVGLGTDTTASEKPEITKKCTKLAGPAAQHVQIQRNELAQLLREVKSRAIPNETRSAHQTDQEERTLR